MPSSSPARNRRLIRSDDSIFLELEWLHLLADEGGLDADFSRVLRRSRVWRLVHPRPRRFPSQAVAIVATTALFPRLALAEAPARAATAEAAEQQVTVSVMDATTHRPVAGAHLRSQSTGERRGVTDARGRAVVPVSAVRAKDLVVEKEGYRPLAIGGSRARPGSSVFVGIVRSGAAEGIATAKPAASAPAVASAPSVKPAAPPTPELHAAATPHPRPTPRPEVWPVKGAAAPTPALEEQEEPTPEPVVTTKPAAKPSARPLAAKKPGKGPGRRVLRTAARVAPEPPGRHEGRYRVLPGDTLWQISRRQYGNPYLWSALYRANRDRIRDADLIYPGQWLDVPGPRSAVAAGHGQITVRRGDTLWEIAGARLGDPTRWHTLYRANRDVVHDPRLIFPGQRLRLPTV